MNNIQPRPVEGVPGFPEGIKPLPKVEPKLPENAGPPSTLSNIEKFMKDDMPKTLKEVAQGIIAGLTILPTLGIMGAGTIARELGKMGQLPMMAGGLAFGAVAGSLGLDKGKMETAGKIVGGIITFPITLPAVALHYLGKCAYLAGETYLLVNILEEKDLGTTLDRATGRSADKIYQNFVEECLKKDFNITPEELKEKVDKKFRGQDGEAFQAILNYSTTLEHNVNLVGTRERMLIEYFNAHKNWNLTDLREKSEIDFGVDPSQFFKDHVLENLYKEPLNKNEHFERAYHFIFYLSPDDSKEHEKFVKEVQLFQALRRNINNLKNPDFADQTPLKIASKICEKYQIGDEWLQREAKKDGVSENMAKMSLANNILNWEKEGFDVSEEAFKSQFDRSYIGIQISYENFEKMRWQFLVARPLNQIDTSVLNQFIVNPIFAKEAKLFNKLKERLPDQSEKTMSEIFSEKFSGMPAEDIRREGILYGNENLAKLKMLNRALLYEKAGIDSTVLLQKKMEATGLTFLTLKDIEKTFKREIRENPGLAFKKTFDKHDVSLVFDPKTKELMVDTKKLGSGTFKVAYLSVNYFKTQANKPIYAVHYTPIIETISEKERPKELSDKEVIKPQPKEKMVEKEGANVSEALLFMLERTKDSASSDMEATINTEYRSLERLEKDLKSAPIEDRVKLESRINQLKKDDEERENHIPTDHDRWIREIEMIEKFKDVKGFLQLHKIVEVNSAKEIYVQVAGYRLPKELTENLKEEKRTVIDLEQMNELNNKDKLSPEGILKLFQIFGQALPPLVHLHEMGKLHRDLKPANILIDPEGNGMVGDLGGVSGIERDPYKSESLGTTPQFAAPEVCLFTDEARWNRIDAKSDVWSSAMTLQDLRFGLDTHPIFAKNPTVLKSDAKAIQNHVASYGPPGSSKAAAYKKTYKEPKDKVSFEHLIWESTQIDPAKRPKMKEFSEKYDAILTKIQEDYQKKKAAS